MAEEALAAMESATTQAENRAALLQAMPFNNDTHQAVREAIRNAQQRLRRLRRAGMLVADLGGEVPVARQSSHRERMAMLIEGQTRRSLGLDETVLKRAMGSQAVRVPQGFNT
jgi:hypothetical protein